MLQEGEFADQAKGFLIQQLMNGQTVGDSNTHPNNAEHSTYGVLLEATNEASSKQSKSQQQQQQNLQGRRNSKSKNIQNQKPPKKSSSGREPRERSNRIVRVRSSKSENQRDKLDNNVEISPKFVTPPNSWKPTVADRIFDSIERAIEKGDTKFQYVGPERNNNNKLRNNNSTSVFNRGGDPSSGMSADSEREFLTDNSIVDTRIPKLSKIKENKKGKKLLPVTNNANNITTSNTKTAAIASTVNVEKQVKMAEPLIVNPDSCSKIFALENDSSEKEANSVKKADGCEDEGRKNLAALILEAFHVPAMKLDNETQQQNHNLKSPQHQKSENEGKTNTNVSPRLKSSSSSVDEERFSTEERSSSSSSPSLNSVDEYSSSCDELENVDHLPESGTDCRINDSPRSVVESHGTDRLSSANVALDNLTNDTKTDLKLNTVLQCNESRNNTSPNVHLDCCCVEEAAFDGRQLFDLIVGMQSKEIINETDDSLFITTASTNNDSISKNTRVEIQLADETQIDQIQVEQEKSGVNEVLKLEYKEEIANNHTENMAIHQDWRLVYIETSGLRCEPMCIAYNVPM